ncbi:MAG: DEAD/DEAH box helicase [Gammaproteobacteria bacterium]|nr:DEAD/DEAH box helicase [Gammaproteobacteria bacterium]
MPSPNPAGLSVPRAGMLAMVRNRRGIVAAVEPFDGQAGRIHLVHVEYKDTQSPADERLLWELEPGCELLEPNALPDSNASPMAADDFDALVRAARWTALSPYLDPDGEGPLRREPIASPFHGSVRVEDYQLVPLIKALRMPRVSLLIADDVGLGKTIEAGLILTELLLRRRIQRILVLTPASLRQQWREELWEKFALRFEVVDRQGTDRLRRRLGMDANPWRSFSRIVASYHYLRQPDVQEQFRAACRTPDGSPHLPWDLLIVDECHNLMPSPFGEDSELCRMLGQIAPAFEHRLFLSATPHNGHTRSFTGLLEMLDPVRFARTNEMNDAMRKRVEDIVIRRLKRDINAAGKSSATSQQPRFCTRNPPKALHLPTNVREVELSDAFAAFRAAIRDLIAEGSRSRRQAGTFAVEVLGKRLLSCPAAFAESWRRARRGLEDQSASDKEVSAAERALRQETGDDRETQQREATAATVVGAWLRNFAGDLQPEIDRIERALSELGFDLDAAEATIPIATQLPVADTRLDTLLDLIECLLLANKTFRADERLVVFTEYRPPSTTLPTACATGSPTSAF